MDPWTLLVIAVALAMDCFAVSLAAGTVSGSRLFGTAAVLALFFGIFQSGMAILGWAAGSWMVWAFGFIDHWIAFLILTVIGAKMVYEGWQGDASRERNYLSLATILVLSIATSVDSFGVGLSLALLSTGIGVAALLIGLVSSVFSFAGVILGCSLASRWGRLVEIAGGIVLLIIGARILMEHLLI